MSEIMTETMADAPPLDMEVESDESVVEQLRAKAARLENLVAALANHTKVLEEILAEERYFNEAMSEVITVMLNVVNAEMAKETKPGSRARTRQIAFGDLATALEQTKTYQAAQDWDTDDEEEEF